MVKAQSDWLAALEVEVAAKEVSRLALEEKDKGSIDSDDNMPLVNPNHVDFDEPSSEECSESSDGDL